MEIIQEEGLGGDSTDASPTKVKLNPKSSSKQNAKPQYKRKIQMNSFIIQKYIEKPLLINKRKFDIRVWVLVSNTGKCYFFKEGYIRTSGTNFYLDPKNADNHYVHLTNNAVQKHSKTYGEFEDGNQMSFQKLQEYIDDYYPEKNINFQKDCVPKMKSMIKHSLLAVRRKLNPNDIQL